MTVAQEIVKVSYGLRAGKYGGQLILPSDWVLASLANKLIDFPSEADLFTESAAQHFTVGTQLRKNGSLWRFCKAGAAMADAGFLKGNYFLCPGSSGNSVNSGFEGAMYAAVVAGATSFTIADTAAAKNEYENATLVIYDDTNVKYQQYTVIGNDASNGTITTLYIAPPGFKVAVTTGYGITIYRNPYMDIRTVTGGYMSALGYARHSITSGYFFWMQTAGPISCITGASTWPGQTQYQRDVFCNTDGSLITGASGTTELYQRVGYLLSRTASDYGDNFIMLQLDQ